MAHTPHRRVILDMDSSESPVHGEQEGAAYNGHFGSVCYHPIFVFNQFRDCEGAMLRPGNVHSADDWRQVLDPILARYERTGVRRPDDPSSVVTSLWAISHYLLLGYFVFGLLGISGIYARQVEEAGLLGLVGFLMFFVWLALSTAFVFIEAFILPLLATEAPQFVESFLGIFGGSVGENSLGVLEAVLPLAVLLYIVGGLLFGISEVVSFV